MEMKQRPFKSNETHKTNIKQEKTHILWHNEFVPFKNTSPKNFEFNLIMDRGENGSHNLTLLYKQNKKLRQESNKKLEAVTRRNKSWNSMAKTLALFPSLKTMFSKKLKFQNRKLQPFHFSFFSPLYEWVCSPLDKTRTVSVTFLFCEYN